LPVIVIVFETTTAKSLNNATNASLCKSHAAIVNVDAILGIRKLLRLKQLLNAVVVVVIEEQSVKIISLRDTHRLNILVIVVTAGKWITPIDVNETHPLNAVVAVVTELPVIPPIVFKLVLLAKIDRNIR
jgi:hypothetical protein